MKKKHTAFKISLYILLVFPGQFLTMQPADADEEALCRPLDDMLPAKPVLTEEADSGELLISADRASLRENEQTVELDGEVILQRGRQVLRAEQVTYRKTGEQAEAQGQVTLWDERFVAQGRHVKLFGDELGEAENTYYWLLGRRGRGSADKINKLSSDKVRLDNTFYTTCDKDNEIWSLGASEINLDFDDSSGEAWGVALYLKDVPVFYTPFLAFPIGNERKSGFLPPRIGNSGNTGFELSLPYYWNIAPNYDATFTPRIMTDRGVMLENEFRYLGRSFQGTLNADYLHHDDEFGDSRYFIKFDHKHRLARGLRTGVSYQEASDNQYLEDLGDRLDLASLTHLRRLAHLTYSGNLMGRRYLMQARLLDHQTLSANPLAKPYARLPQLIWRTTEKEHNRQLNYGLSSEYVYFDHDLSVPSTKPTGGRFDAKLSLSYPLRYPGGFFVPSVFARHTHYMLDDQPADVQENLSRSLGGGDIDAGLFFERDAQLGDTELLHTLEPRLFYVYVPRETQDDLPVFDTGVYDFSFSQLFRPERFNGPDRVGDENRLTLALTSRLLHRQKGYEPMRVSVGRIFYFSDREVVLPRRAVETEEFSDIVTEVAARFTEHWSLLHTMQWHPENEQTHKSIVRLRYHSDPGMVFNLSYRYRDQKAEQTDLSWQWPLTKKWSTVGRWNYSLRYNSSLDSFLGVQYNTCCLALRLVGRRYLTNLEGDYNDGVFFQVEFKGLTGIGRKTESFLKEHIPAFNEEF